MFGTYTRLPTTVMDENAALGILQHLNTDDLRQLLDDEAKLNEIIMDLPQVKNLLAEKENLLLTNNSLAEYNLSREPKLQQGKQMLGEVYERGVAIQKEYEQVKQKCDFHGAQQNVDTTLALLQTAGAEAEEESEVVADNFLEGNLEVEDFKKQFIDTRILTHLRKVKVEKMQEILRNRNRAAYTPSYGANMPTRAAPPPPVNSWNNIPSSPYAPGT